MKIGKNTNILKRVLVFGYDGTGKSHFVEEYCNDHGLKSVVIDFDDTNFESADIAEFKLRKQGAWNNKAVLDLIDEVKYSKKYDTIVFDGIGTLFENLLGNGKGRSKYLPRSEYWKDIREALLGSDLNFIFVGQIDMEIKFRDDDGNPVKPSKLLIQLHSLVNEKYFCELTKEGFTQTILKYRTNNELVGKTYDSLKKRLNISESVERVKDNEVITDVTPSFIEC